MNLSPNQLRTNARKFSNEWKNESRERAESQTFWNEFFLVFGINRRHVGIFEAAFKKLSGSQAFIDVFWPKVLVCEQKSRGADLDKAVDQAIGYLQAIAKVASEDLPRYVIVCDFERLRIHDIETGNHQEILVAELADHLHLFGFLSGYLTQIKVTEEAANIKAAEKMGLLHDQLEVNGYEGHELKVMLIRLLFCLFAEDTGIFEKYQFANLIQQRTREDGSDLAGWLSHLFETLNRPVEKRLKNLDEQLKDFAYINGDLFKDHMPLASFDTEMRQVLLDAAALDWADISPEIFGALFQSVMDKKERRNLGAHYTSEENILKVISSLFLDELRADFAVLKAKGKGKARTAALDVFHDKLASLTFLDPACGCGNFLIVAYRELRMLELDVIEQLHKKGQLLDVSTVVRCNVSQFFGIEIEEFPSQIARVAMWLVDHQMNMLVSEHFGVHFARIPLTQSAHIDHANALQVDWPVTDFILGNPPFKGKKEQTKEDKKDLMAVCYDIKGAGNLDFVCSWYVKAARLMNQNPKTRSAFVATNSICQGEQVPILWSWMLAQSVYIQFAHRTFVWQSAAKGKAAVHCVIVGFGLDQSCVKTIFEYEKGKGIPTAIVAANINPYLANAASHLITNRRNAICKNAKKMDFGSKAVDFGHLVLSAEEKHELEVETPEASDLIRPFIGSDEFIHNKLRYCLWLKNADPHVIKKSKIIQSRLQSVKESRLLSEKEDTRKWADFPSLFVEDRQPKINYLLVPKVSSEKRAYIPLDFFEPEFIVNPSVLVVPEANFYDLGVIQSLMHMSWMRVVCGRMKSDYQYSNTIVYNNFPWPLDPTEKQKATIEAAAQAVLDARAAHPDSSLADLYDPLLMPPNLTKAHQQLDKAVDAAYGRRSFATEAERVAFLFELYQQYTAPTAPMAEDPKPKTRRKKTAETK